MPRCSAARRAENADRGCLDGRDRRPSRRARYRVLAASSRWTAEIVRPRPSSPRRGLRAKPVKVMIGQSGCRTSASLAYRRSVHDVPRLPRAGLPVERSTKRSAKRRRVSAGFSTTVCRKRAQAELPRGMAIGKFQGVIARPTTTGVRTDMLNLSRELRRRRLPPTCAGLAGHVVGHVDASWTSPPASA